MSAPRVSAVIFISQRGVMEELYGKAAVTRAISKLDPELAAEIGALLPVSWISSDATLLFFEAVAVEADITVGVVQRDVVRIGVERTVRTIWRVLLRFTSDDALVRRTPMIYSKTFDRGAMTTRIAGPGRAEIVITGWPAMPQVHADGITYGVEAVLRVAGRQDVKVEHHKRIDGALYVATWKV